MKSVPGAPGTAGADHAAMGSVIRIEDADPRRHVDWRRRHDDGKVYRLPRGRHAPNRDRIEDKITHPFVVDLRTEKPEPAHFVRTIVRELRIRFYQRRTISAYCRALASFLRWLRAPPHEATREDVRQYLELLVDAGASSSWVSVNLSALRTIFDKMCGESITLGLQTPRRPKILPVVLSPNEIRRLLQAAPSIRDKLLLGLMYATGARVSEVVRLRWRDLDFDRHTIRIDQGKGRKDRYVPLPSSFEQLLQKLAVAAEPAAFVFPATNDARRHLSPRTAQRAMERARTLAQIGKPATCHSLRHSFATHLLENGTDIRFIQKALGHAKLETTTLYTRVARAPDAQAKSPLDILTERTAPPQPERARTPKEHQVSLRFVLTPTTDQPVPEASASIFITGEDVPLRLDGITLKRPRDNWVTVDLPPEEDWARTLAWLSREKRERLQTTDFFQFLQRELTRRFLALR